MGEEFEGPAVVEEGSSACYVPLGWLARVDEDGNLRLKGKA
jgi:N-methylhydantoinase A/oxoprolinase/acetone carboxylase beta subunit